MNYKSLNIILLICSLNLPITSWAMLLPSEMYAQANESAEKKDYHTAFAYYRQAALRGHIESQRSLGAMYLLGKGTQQNTIEGLKWLTQAAQQKDTLAQFILALAYKLGQYDITIDETKSHYWLNQIKAQDPILALWYEALVKQRQQKE